jgi:ATP-dependent RNA helicase DeaD
MQKKAFTELNLSKEVLQAVAALGFEEASPIQSEAIPVQLAGKDLVGQSQTGSGKTAAFAIPVIEKIDPSLHAPQALILCPTRELVVQVAEQTAKLASFKKGVRELPIYGGQSYDRQFRGLQQGAHIVIGTPGRIMDHLNKGTLKLDKLKTLVLDEADRMLDMGFLDDIRYILDRAPKERQTVLFSATVPNPIKELIRTFTRNPEWVKIEGQAMTAPAIEQQWYEVDRRSKVEALCRLIDMEDTQYAIIFCATKNMVDELTERLLARGYPADKLHGDMSQAMRERVMTRFRRRTVEILVATDVAARGLDVQDIEVVFNFDLPNDADDYTHRIGRTGRAGKVGKAITLVAGRETHKLNNIIRFTGGQVKRCKVPTLEEVEKRRADVFFNTLKDTLEKAEFKNFDHYTDRLLDQGYSTTDIISAVVTIWEKENTKSGADAIPDQHLSDTSDDNRGGGRRSGGGRGPSSGGRGGRGGSSSGSRGGSGSRRESSSSADSAPRGPNSKKLPFWKLRDHGKTKARAKGGRPGSKPPRRGPSSDA